MLLHDTLLLSFAALCTSALTTLVGAGGGTVLLMLMLQTAPPVVAIPLHGAVQLASNSWRVWLFRGYMAWPLIVRFVALMPFGVALGLWALQGLPQNAIEIMIGGFALASLSARRLKSLRHKELPLWAFVPLGFVTGALNMVVGVIAPVLGVLIVRKDLPKEGIVGTLGFFAFAGNLFKIAGFTIVGFDFLAHWTTLAAMVPAAMLGTLAGKRLLVRVNATLFLTLFQIVLVALGAKLILDGLDLT